MLKDIDNVVMEYGQYERWVLHHNGMTGYVFYSPEESKKTAWVFALFPSNGGPVQFTRGYHKLDIALLAMREELLNVPSVDAWFEKMGFSPMTAKTTCGVVNAQRD